MYRRQMSFDTTQVGNMLVGKWCILQDDRSVEVLCDIFLIQVFWKATLLLSVFTVKKKMRRLVVK